MRWMMPRHGHAPCQVCQGEGMVYRPERDVEHFIEIETLSENGDVITDERLVVTKTGGIDACPVCAAQAELEFQSGPRRPSQPTEPLKLKVIK
ncbi:MAG: hypothetical protein HQL35_09505 [Alphaproteobacteria bacterium]|nr:hypothetical protein [Alphaproteobacteria bacterium]